MNCGCFFRNSSSSLVKQWAKICSALSRGFTKRYYDSYLGNASGNLLGSWVRAHLETATPLGGSPEFIPVSITIGLIDGAEVAKAAFGPELAATFEATLALAAG